MTVDKWIGLGGFLIGMFVFISITIGMLFRLDKRRAKEKAEENKELVAAIIQGLKESGTKTDTHSQ